MDHDRIDDTVGEPPGEWPEHFEGRAKIQPFPNPFPADGAAVFAVPSTPAAGAGPTPTSTARC